MIYEQIHDLAQIRALHESKASTTWGSGSRDEEGRVLLSYYSPSHPGGDAVIQYCTVAGWKQAYGEHISAVKANRASLGVLL